MALKEAISKPPAPAKTTWHTQETTQVLDQLGTTIGTGLTDRDVRKRLNQSSQSERGGRNVSGNRQANSLAYCGADSRHHGIWDGNTAGV